MLAEQTALAASYGITSVQNMHELGPAPLQAVEQAASAGALKVRIYTVVTLDKEPPSAERMAQMKGLRQRWRGPLLKFGGAKGILDGTIDAKTAWMLQPYVGGGNGLSYYTWPQLRDAVALYDREGFQVMLHATGDATIDMAMRAFEHAAEVNGAEGRRHRIEHIDIVWPDLLQRMKRLGVIASSQPNFGYPDSTNLQNYAVLLGPERMARAQAYGDIDRAGVLQIFASDYPVSPMDVLKAIHTAVTRTTREGTPPGGWYPAQRISVEAALRHFTRDGAYASFDEAEKGTLTAGKLADFVVLSDDILTAPPERLLTAKVLLTVMGGRTTFEAK